ncbi:uncharacterized protein MONOS_4182 [Monocercomonoides exilis]|uniref:uncharacterized protein n=1 Tax=Monocercomonoides exilis TaxID=2049356 RepID=UPI0035597DBA|nr:hypothetical protein MONOS_4182 [Monocercomonoides exilis]|eukprot:MONOS_4182.1-p1 / transcript=MONOS_4182.1 / gene=MONOS_4182 / organism=Monocercomonoides_exilis_PA203 / gene_product=unspecified product / transcript_product=unspecified product / location=Mono_scaffold00107:93590-94582(+) / protein_length=331 / sequence_SO=supercontig / SO=protein_coding / is_pseudo=false
MPLLSSSYSTSKKQQATKEKQEDLAAVAARLGIPYLDWNSKSSQKDAAKIHMALQKAFPQQVQQEKRTSTQTSRISVEKRTGPQKVYHQKSIDSFTKKKKSQVPEKLLLHPSQIVREGAFEKVFSKSKANTKVNSSSQHPVKTPKVWTPFVAASLPAKRSREEMSSAPSSTYASSMIKQQKLEKKSSDPLHVRHSQNSLNPHKHAHKKEHKARDEVDDDEEEEDEDMDGDLDGFIDDAPVSTSVETYLKHQMEEEERRDRIHKLLQAQGYQSTIRSMLGMPKQLSVLGDEEASESTSSDIRKEERISMMAAMKEEEEELMRENAKRKKLH